MALTTTTRTPHPCCIHPGDKCAVFCIMCVRQVVAALDAKLSEQLAEAKAQLAAADAQLAANAETVARASQLEVG